MEVVKISNKKDNLTNDFKYSDFWKGTDFELYECLPKAIQFIREYYGIPFTITSTYRPNDALTLPEAHRIQPPAIDCVTTDRSKWNDIRNDIRNEFKEWMTSKLVHGIIATGTNIMIIENVCLHLHYRKNKIHQTRQYGGIYIGEWKPDGKAGINTAYSFNTI